MEVVPVFQPFGQCLDRRFRRGIETAQCFRGSDSKAKILGLEARAEGGEEFSVCAVDLGKGLGGCLPRQGPVAFFEESEQLRDGSLGPWPQLAQGAGGSYGRAKQTPPAGFQPVDQRVNDSCLLGRDLGQGEGGGKTEASILVLQSSKKSRDGLLCSGTDLAESVCCP